MDPDRGLRELLRATADALLDTLYPALCPLCGAREEEDEDGCPRHRLPGEPTAPRCRRCGLALPPSLPDGARCAACRRRAPGFRRLVCLGDYRAGAPLREWVLALKHGGRADLAGPLGRRLAGAWEAAVGRRACSEALLVPVPLHPLRRLARGHDQALGLAREVGAGAGVEVVRALVRRRNTPPQGGPGASSRSANVRDAFGARRRAGRRVRDRAVWLVDDVVTSGATAAACARALRRAGAAEVSVLCAARAPAPRAGLVVARAEEDALREA